MQKNKINNDLQVTRYLWADTLKGLLIILVILGHSIQSVICDDCHSSHFWNLIYSFHMPAFMAVSGWLAYRGNRCQNPVNFDLRRYLNGCKRRAKQLLVPYFVWSLIQFALSCNYAFDNLIKIVIYPDAYF